jgi:hypothetical protein
MIDDVSRVVDGIAKSKPELKVVAFEGTRLAAAFKKS